MQDVELLQFIHATAEMGVKGLKNVSGQIHSPDLRQKVNDQIAEYRAVSQRSAALLQAKGEDPKDPGVMAKLSSEVMAAVETLADPSDSKVAELVIQGNNMGVTKGTKHLHDYRGDDPQIRALAEKLLADEEANIEQMKPFL